MIRKRFEKFCTDTSMHGFLELFYAKTVFWTLVWFVLLVCAIGVTIYQMIGQVGQFIDQPQITTVQPAESSDVLYPPLKICYPHWLYWVDWAKVEALHFTVPAALYGLSYLTWIYTDESFYDAQASYTRAMANNNMANVLEFYKAISVDPSKTFTGVNFNRTDFKVDMATGRVKLCQTLEGDDIPNAITNAQPSGTKKPSPSATNVLQLGINYTDFTNNGSPITDIQYQAYIRDWLMDENFNYQSSDYDLTQVQLPILLYPNAYDANSIMIPRDTDMMRIVITESISIVKPTASSPCVDGLRWLGITKECMASCASQFIPSMLKQSTIGIPLALAMTGNDYQDTIVSNGFCHASGDAAMDQAPDTTAAELTTLATTTTSTINTTSTCTSYSDQYMALMSTTTAQYTTCTKNCNVGCIAYKFDFTQQPFTLFQRTNPMENNFTKIAISFPSVHDVLVMMEQDSKTWQDFVSNVGGLLGIWTGASILSFFQMVYLCCCPDCGHSSSSKVDHEEPEPKKSEMENDKYCEPAGIVPNSRPEAWYM